MEEQLGKYFAGEATEQEVAEILRWRNESAENARVFFEAKSLWASAGERVSDAPKQVLSNIIGSDEAPTKTRSLWPYVGYAATIAILMGFAWWFFMQPSDKIERDLLLPMVEIHQLEDGSKVTLYRGSHLSVLKMSDDQRLVQLNGKGFFDVARDESRPFVVYTDNAKVEVLGTSFVVDTEGLQGTQVLVASGKVSMAAKEETAASKPVLLEVGEKGTLSSGEAELEKQPIEDENFMAWSSGILSFDRDQLSEVGKVLQEVYGLEVSFTNGDASACQLTAKYRRKSREEVVRLIADTFDMKYRISGDQVQFSGKGCQ